MAESHTQSDLKKNNNVEYVSGVWKRFRFLQDKMQNRANLNEI